MALKLVPISEIQTNAPHQLNQDKVRQYIALLELGEQPPPIKLYRRGSGYIVRDGYHRLAAAIALGRTHIMAQVW